MAETETRLLKVGELARRTGLTVRTLHHYDAIGLLPPSRRSGSGHRLYGAVAVARLQQIVSLRQIGLSLEQIRELLERPEASLERILQMHLERLREQLRLQGRLCQRLETMLGKIRLREDVGVEELLQTMEAMAMYEKYFTDDQLRQLEDRRELVGEERIREVEREWQQIIPAFREAMEKGTDPSDPSVIELSRRAAALVREFSGGDREIEASVGRMYQAEESVRQKSGMEPELWEYMGRATAARNAASNDSGQS